MVESADTRDLKFLAERKQQKIHKKSENFTKYMLVWWNRQTQGT